MAWKASALFVWVVLWAQSSWATSIPRLHLERGGPGSFTRGEPSLHGTLNPKDITRAAAEADRIQGGDGTASRARGETARKLLQEPAYNVTLRYTACGGLFNQQYSHLAALLLALKLKAKAVIWPPMQERKSFNNRFSTYASLNEQTWIYMNANSIWDIGKTAWFMREEFGLDILPHHSNCRIPSMVYPRGTFQRCHTPSWFDGIVRFPEHVYLERFTPEDLASRVTLAIQREYQGRAMPSNILIDLPCTLFMIDVRQSPVVERLSKAIRWNPQLVQLADKVIAGIRSQTQQQDFNGVHLRMEKDAQDWARVIGSMSKYWLRYKIAMRRAGFADPPTLPLYVASGLLKASKEDSESKGTMDRIAHDIIHRQFATQIVHKELYLSPQDLEISNEQSALVDYLVLLAAKKVVGVGVSTFSFYLHEARLTMGRPPQDTELVMLPKIGSDELFFTCALVALETRWRLQSQHLLKDTCRRPDLQRCFLTTPPPKPALAAPPPPHTESANVLQTGP